MKLTGRKDTRENLTKIRIKSTRIWDVAKREAWRTEPRAQENEGITRTTAKYRGGRRTDGGVFLSANQWKHNRQADPEGWKGRAKDGPDCSRQEERPRRTDGGSQSGRKREGDRHSNFVPREARLVRGGVDPGGKPPLDDVYRRHICGTLLRPRVNQAESPHAITFPFCAYFHP